MKTGIFKIECEKDFNIDDIKDGFAINLGVYPKIEQLTEENDPIEK